MKKECDSMFERGVYQMNFRGLTIKECWRFGGFKGFPIALVLKAIRFMGPSLWLPATECQSVCDKSDLSPACIEALSEPVRTIGELGFTRGNYLKTVISIDAGLKDSGAFIGIHNDGSKFSFVAYIDNVTTSMGQSIATKRTSSSIGYVLENDRTVEFLNHNNFLDNEVDMRHVYPDNSIKELNARLQESMRAEMNRIKVFHNVSDFMKFSEKRDIDDWQKRIDRKLYIKVPQDKERELLTAANKAR